MQPLNGLLVVSPQLAVVGSMASQVRQIIIGRHVLQGRAA